MGKTPVSPIFCSKPCRPIKGNKLVRSRVLALKISKVFNKAAEAILSPDEKDYQRSPLRGGWCGCHRSQILAITPLSLRNLHFLPFSAVNVQLIKWMMQQIRPRPDPTEGHKKSRWLVGLRDFYYWFEEYLNVWALNYNGQQQLRIYPNSSLYSKRQQNLLQICPYRHCKHKFLQWHAIQNLNQR